MAIRPKHQFRTLDMTPAPNCPPKIRKSELPKILKKIYNIIIAFFHFKRCPTCQVFFNSQTHICLDSMILIPSLKNSILGFYVESKTIREIEANSHITKLMRLHKFVYMQNSVYIDGVSAFHGYNINLCSYVKLRAKPVKKTDSALALGNGIIYTLGGILKKIIKSDSCEIYNIAKNNWESIAKMIKERSGFSACTSGGNIYAIGGLAHPDSPDAIEYYHNGLKVWRVLEIKGLNEKIMNSVCVGAREHDIIVFYDNQSEHAIARLTHKAKAEWDVDRTISSEFPFAFKYSPIVNSHGVHLITKDLKYINYDGYCASLTKGNMFESYSSILPHNKSKKL